MVYIVLFLINSSNGFISATELANIQNSHDPQQINHLIIHHHFIPLHAKIDNYILAHPKELIAILDRLNINHVFTGHVHNGIVKTQNKLNIYHCPSTCIQFSLTQELNLENIIGYRIITLDKSLLCSHIKLFAI